MPLDNLQIVFYQKDRDPGAEDTPEAAGTIWVNRKTGATWVSREVEKSGQIVLEWIEKTTVLSDLAVTDPNSLAFVRNKQLYQLKVTPAIFDAWLGNSSAMNIIIALINKEF